MNKHLKCVFTLLCIFAETVRKCFWRCGIKEEEQEEQEQEAEDEWDAEDLIPLADLIRTTSRRFDLQDTLSSTEYGEMAGEDEEAHPQQDSGWEDPVSLLERFRDTQCVACAEEEGEEEDDNCIVVSEDTSQPWSRSKLLQKTIELSREVRRQGLGEAAVKLAEVEEMIGESVQKSYQSRISDFFK